MSYTAMSPAFVRTALVLALAASAAGRAFAENPGVVVRVYDGSATDTAIRETALRTAAAIVAETGILAEWHDCTARAGENGCTLARAPRDLILRIIPDIDPGEPATRSALQLDIDGRPSILGFAVTDAHTGTGVFATIFMSRVNALAERTGFPPSYLLGRVLAHEAGHLLLGPQGHSSHGLMRPVWTPAELHANRADDWAFSAADRQQMQDRLTMPHLH
jgi:hypothetical protein